MVGTSTDRDVVVTVQVFAAEPSADHGAFDRVVEATVEVPSGWVAVLDDPAGLSVADRFDLPPGLVRVRVSHSGPAAAGVGAPERVRVRLWPVGEGGSEGVRVVKGRGRQVA